MLPTALVYDSSLVFYFIIVFKHQITFKSAVGQLLKYVYFYYSQKSLHVTVAWLKLFASNFSTSVKMYSKAGNFTPKSCDNQALIHYF